MVLTSLQQLQLEVQTLQFDSEFLKDEVKNLKLRLDYLEKDLYKK